MHCVYGEICVYDPVQYVRRALHWERGENLVFFSKLKRATMVKQIETSLLAIPRFTFSKTCINLVKIIYGIYAFGLYII